MSIVRKTISLTEEQDAWVKSKVTSGGFTNDSEVHRSLVKRVQELEAKEDAFYAEVQKGIESGTSPRSIDEIVESARNKARKMGLMPSQD